jgi:hypothetical protein
VVNRDRRRILSIVGPVRYPALGDVQAHQPKPIVVQVQWHPLLPEPAVVMDLAQPMVQLMLVERERARATVPDLAQDPLGFLGQGGLSGPVVALGLARLGHGLAHGRKLAVVQVQGQAQRP